MPQLEIQPLMLLCVSLIAAAIDVAFVGDAIKESYLCAADSIRVDVFRPVFALALESLSESGCCQELEKETAAGNGTEILLLRVSDHLGSKCPPPDIIEDISVAVTLVVDRYSRPEAPKPANSSTSEYISEIFREARGLIAYSLSKYRATLESIPEEKMVCGLMCAIKEVLSSANNRVIVSFPSDEEEDVQSAPGDD